jgi:phosphoglucosamine mutase
VELYPQVLINVRVPERFDFNGAPVVKEALKAAEGELNQEGRVLLRASGTEPLIRVMVEGRSRPQVQHCAEAIARSVEQAAAAR